MGVSYPLSNIPEALFEQFCGLAKQEHRSLNSQLLDLLSQSVAEPDSAATQLERIRALRNHTVATTLMPADIMCTIAEKPI